MPLEGWGMAHSGKCLLYKHEDLNLITRICVKSEAWGVCLYSQHRGGKDSRIYGAC